MNIGTSLLWAKTDVYSWKAKDAECTKWLPLWCHLDDTGAVAGRLFDYWLTPLQKRTLTATLVEQGLSQQAAESRIRELLVFLGSVHDIGKASPPFSSKQAFLNDRLRVAGLRHDELSPDLSKLAKHAIVGHIVLEEWLLQQELFKNNPKLATGIC